MQGSSHLRWCPDEYGMTPLLSGEQDMDISNLTLYTTLYDEERNHALSTAADSCEIASNAGSS